MKDWRKQIAPYEGSEPYLYLAFADADAGRIRDLVRLLLQRGVRIWYSTGPAGSADELLRRQQRALGASLTAVYLTDAMTQDQDGKASVLVNQKNGRKILCIDRDSSDRALNMGLHESIPHLAAWQYHRTEDLEEALVRTEGFTQEMIGDPVFLKKEGLTGRLTALLCVLSLLLLLGGFLGLRVFHWFQPELPQDTVEFADPTVREAARIASGSAVLTEESVAAVTELRLESLPDSWEDLEKLPNLERIVLPQDAVLEAESLPGEDFVLVLTGGDES
ncbi:MAG: hypothetical protein IKS55_04550 [Oscillospiraceae bacterium]|nr:hypothetical protein [Oscillospiraceae bacterium]